jgi:hypothetical protein
LEDKENLAGDAVGIEPVSTKLLQKMEFSLFLAATRISLILNFAFSGIPKTPRQINAWSTPDFMSAQTGIKLFGLLHKNEVGSKGRRQAWPLLGPAGM